MNAAARLVHRHGLSKDLVLSHLLTPTQLALGALALSSLVTALVLVFTIHGERDLYALSQRNLYDVRHLQIDESKLLLEKSSHMLQAEMHQVAKQQLAMNLPLASKVVVVHE